MDLNHYVDKDKMFTVLFLRSLPANSDLRNKCVLEILEYLRVIENDKESSNNVSGQLRDMPVYTHLQTWISKVYMAAQKLENRDCGSNKEVKHGGKFDNRNKQFVFNRGVDQSNDTEIAASTSKRFPRDGPDAALEYDRLVSREDNVWFTDSNSGSRFPYVHKTDNCRIIYWWDAGKSSVWVNLTREWRGSSKTAKQYQVIHETMLVLNDIRSGKFQMTEKLDSGASRCMSGNPHRLVSSNSMSNVTMLGFNRSMSKDGV
eukprot:gene13099-27651_t